MRPSLAARALRFLGTGPHFKGKDRLVSLLESRVPLPTLEQTTTFPDGMVMALDSRLAFERTFYFHNAEQDTYDFITRTLRAGDVFFDCGANVGFYSLVAARRVGPSGRVHAFEPTPSTFAKLERNLAIDRAVNATAHRLAIGERAGTAHIWQLSEDNHGMNTIAAVEGAADAGACAIRSLDELVAEGTLARPQLIKIDVEGSELALLHGARDLLAQGPAPTLIIELSRATMRPFGYEPEEVVAYLQSLRRWTVEWPFLGRQRPVDTAAPLPHYARLGAEHGANYVFRPLD